MRKHTGFEVPPGSSVYLHQAFKCCPYAGMITSQIYDYLERNAFTLVEDPALADVQLINSCGSDSRNAAQTFDAVASVRDLAPGTPIVVTGCLNSIEPKAVARSLEGVADTAMLDPRHLSGLDELFKPAVVPFDSVRTSLKNRYAGTAFSDHWYHVGVSTGCFGTCTFCAIRRATGRPRSNPIQGVLADVRRGLSAGHPDVLLVSTDVSAWGADLGLTVVDLLSALSDMPEDVMFSAEAFEPKLFLEHFDALLEVFRRGRFSFIGLPIQSGSQRILDQMERDYDIRAVLDAVRRLKVAAPDLLVRTDILYGFGDETDEDFEASRLAGRAFDVASYNAYRERPGTAPIRLSQEVVDRRHLQAMDELRFLAQRGVPAAKRIIPIPDDQSIDWDIEGDRLAHDDVKIAEPPAPDLMRWLTSTRLRFANVIEKRGTIKLGNTGWAIDGAHVHDVQRAVILVMRNAAGQAVDVGLRRPDQSGPAMARSDRFAMWIVTPGFTPTPDQDIAIKALIAMLELKLVPGQDRP